MSGLVYVAGSMLVILLVHVITRKHGCFDWPISMPLK